MNTTAEFIERIATSSDVNYTVAEELAALYPPNGTERVLDQIVATYPNDLPDELGHQYKRFITFLTDYCIVAPTRLAVQSWAQYDVP